MGSGRGTICRLGNKSECGLMNAVRGSGAFISESSNFPAKTLRASKRRVEPIEDGL